MGLFDKKYCDICGGKIGFLGNRKLEDGNLCKDCAGKLSPWFDERRHSTVAQIKEQLAYREANKEAVAAFHTTRTLGRDCKVLIDEDAKRFMVTSARDLAEANPDVLEFGQVTGCDMDIKEYRTEETHEVHNADGTTENVSYDPPRYWFSYDFYMQIRVNSPYFDEIRFRLNSSSVEIHSGVGMGTSAPVNGAAGYGSQQADVMGSVIQGLANAISQAGRSSAGSLDPRLQNPDYVEYYNMGQEIKEVLTQIHEKLRDDKEAAAAPRTAVTCPHCGAVTLPDANGCCEFCGGALNDSTH